MSKTATTGPENPLKTYTEYVPSSFLIFFLSSHTAHLLRSEEKAQITAAEQAYNTAMDAFRSAREHGEPKERVDELRNAAREKEEVLKGLQDLCD
jgi:hypothetical protein